MRGCQTSVLAIIRPSLLLGGDAQLLSYVNVVIGQPVGRHDSFHGGAIAQRDAKQVFTPLNHVDGVLG